MNKKLYTYHSSLVPVLACIAALLFSANFYQFMQKQFKKWWGWDFSCPTEEVHHRHQVYELKPHDDHVIVFDSERDFDFDFNFDFDFDASEMDHETDRALQDLERAKQASLRNLERAVQKMARLHERMEWDSHVEIHVERLDEEIRIKAQNLENLERALQRMEFEIEQAGPDHRHKHRRKHHRKRKHVRIRVHR